jgi:cyclic beta-1,2-glucan synthetase
VSPVIGFFLTPWRGALPPAEKPFRDELLSIERLEERALSLAASFTIDPSPKRRARNIFPRFNDNARVLRRAYGALGDDVRNGQPITPAAEWLLDNFHLLTSEIRDIRQHLRGRAPRAAALASREHSVTRESTRWRSSWCGTATVVSDRQQLAVFMNLSARRAADDLASCGRGPPHWLALIENLRRLAVGTMAARQARLDRRCHVSRDRERRRRRAAAAGRPDPTFIVQLLHRL